MRLLAWLGIVVAVLGVAIRFGLGSEGDVLPVTCEMYPELCSTSIMEGTAPITDKNGLFKFGRWKNPSDDLSTIRNLGTPRDQLFRLKGWGYLSVVTPKYFLAITPVQFNYIEDVYISVINRETETQTVLYHWQFPFPALIGKRLGLGSSSTDGCTHFSSFFGTNTAKICFSDNTWHFDLTMAEVTANIQVTKGDEAMLLLYPLGADKNRPAYVHKEAGMNAKGVIHVKSDKTPHHFTNGAGATDWTLTHALRDTWWRWVSMNCVQATVNGKVVQVGINLSTLVYDVTKNDEVFGSSENALFIDHKVFPINAVAKIEPTGKDLGKDMWKVTVNSKHCVIDLDFEPHGTRADHTGIGLQLIGIVSDFVQPFGKFNGTIEYSHSEGGKKTVYHVGIENSQCYGVCEDHHSVW